MKSDIGDMTALNLETFEGAAVNGTIRKLSFDEAEIKAVVFNEFNKYKEMIQNE